MGSDQRKRGIGSGIPEKSSAGGGGGKGPRASLEVAVALALDGFLDAQQHRGEPLIQPRDGVEFLHLAPAKNVDQGAGGDGSGERQTRAPPGNKGEGKRREKGGGNAKKDSKGKGEGK